VPGPPESPPRRKACPRADSAPLFKISSANALRNVMKANGGNSYTPHGFRTSFQGFVAAETNFPDDLADRCIAHEKRSKVRRSYQRDDLLPKRREIMVAWSDFVTGVWTAIHPTEGRRNDLDQRS
jgi:hypothetical protein